MKASEAKILVAKHKEIKDTVSIELKIIFRDIEATARSGGVDYHYHRGWLNSNNYDEIIVTNDIINLLKHNGYVVEEHNDNPNRPWLLISWG